MLEEWLSWQSLADMGLAALIVFALLSRLRGAKSALVVLVFSALALAYAGARTVGLTLTATLLLALLLSGLFFAGVVCHDDVRRWLDRTSARLFGRRGADTREDGVAPMIVQAVTQMARSSTGALIVLPGDQDIEPEVHGGVPLEGQLTVPLLLSLFDPGSPGHDGAVVIRGGRVASFGVHLPLCEDVERLGGRGTRHAAALGLSERTDALCLVVSEERGEISVADRGTLRAIDPKLLLRTIRAHGGATRSVPLPSVRRSRPLVALQAVLAVAMAAVGWLAVVAGGETSTRRFEAGVQVANLPEGMAVRGFEPEAVEVVLSGTKRSLLLTSDDDVRVELDGRPAEAGRRVFAVSPEDVRAPEGLAVVEIRPSRVRLEVDAPGPG